MARKKEPVYKKIDLINKIVEMTCSGYLQPEVIKWLKTEASLEISYIYELLRQAKPIILDILRDTGRDRLETSIRELEQLLLEAKEAKDNKLVLEIKKEIHKISGLHNQKIDVTTNGENINQISILKLIEVKKDDDVSE